MVRGEPESSKGETVSATDDRWMREALEEARRAAALGEVPVGAVVVREGTVVGRAHNRREIDRDPLAHAEILAIEQAAAALAAWRLSDCAIYVTLEPCAMCAGALVNARVARLVFGARDPKAGFCGSLGNLARDPRLNHRLEVVQGVLAEECGAELREFFAALRRRGQAPPDTDR
jgi:tRNA(adenine34) deaminase